MYTESIQTEQHQRDIYASRGGVTAKIVPRRDPILYCDIDDSGVIDSPALQSYRKNGFLVVDKVFTQVEVNTFLQEMENLAGHHRRSGSDEAIVEAGSAEVRSVFRIHETSPLFKRVASDRRLASIAEQILNDRVYIHQSRVNFKPGFRGEKFYWHSDFETWHVEDGMPRMRALSASITLTENYPWNGPLMFIPGSHKYYVVCEGETPEENYKRSLRRQELGIPDDAHLRSLYSEGGIHTVVGKPGSVVFFDCNVLHGSSGNITPAPRSNLFFVYNALSNRVRSPYCDCPPRPEYLCSRKNVTPI